MKNKITVSEPAEPYEETCQVSLVAERWAFIPEAGVRFSYLILNKYKRGIA